MQFHRLRLSGFKSFVEPATLRIEPGLTGIVGPNGCGKSNLLEAIRWVMGENSPKSMRSGGMEDVIFAGTDTRPERAFAEVVLSASDDAGDELEVTRRIERGAGSAYRINGADARAKDVALTFADAATGAHSPALVSQGRIAQVIAAKPVERRQMLEEAAGIAGLHVRRRDAEAKLRQTEANLARLEDLLSGLSSQIASLTRQARQAERYRIVTGEIETAEARLVFARWRDATHAAKEAHAAAQNAEARVSRAKDAADTASRAQRAAAQALANARERHSDRRADASAHGHRMATLSERFEAAQTRLTDLDQQRERLKEDRDTADRMTVDAAQALRTLERDLIASRQAAAEAESERPALFDRSEETERHRRAAELAQARALADHAKLEAELRVAEAAMEQAEARLRRLKRESERIAASEAQLGAASDHQDMLETARATGEAARACVAKLRAQLDADRERKQHVQRECDEAASALAAAKAELAGVEREHTALTRDRAARAKAMANRADRDVAIDGVRVAPGYERAVAAALGRDGQALLHTPDACEEGRFWTGRDAPDAVSDSLFAHVIECPAQLRARLALVHVADEDDGRALAPGEWLVTRSGHLRRWDGFVARGEGAGEAARLEAANRLAKLDAQLPSLRHTVDTATTCEAQARHALSDLQVKLTAGDRELAAAIEDERAALRQIDQAEGMLERDAARRKELRLARQEIDGQVRAASAEQAAATKARSALPSPDAGRAAVDEARARHGAATTTMQGALAALAAHDQNAAVLRERLAAQTSEWNSWKARAGEATTRMAQAGQRLEEIEEERAIIQARPDALMTEIAQGEAVRERLAAELEAARVATEGGQLALDTADHVLAEAIETLATAREGRATLAARAESESARRAEMGRISGERFQCPPPLLPDRFAFAEDDVVSASEESTRMDRLVAAREQIGPVNLVAADELARIEAEHGTNAEEQAELAEAVGRLRGSIGALNREGRERLRAAFEQVDAHFQVLFARLFQGGRAHLALDGSDDPLEAGLEIYAQPPGKRLQSLTLLSGGEQALTATALIFALFLTNPAPICVLDEVDAPLDDANVERFCDLLDTMVRTTQTRYLIVTHNAVTMSRMHRLFGVTMAEQGVSRLVSVDLGEAALMAAE